MDIKTAFIISTIVALSGWGTIFYNIFTSNPKIDGRILNLMTAEMMIKPQFDKPKTILFPYLYLVNKRKNPVNILDYELYFDIGNGYERALRVYGTNKLPQPTFGGPYFEVSIPDFTKKLIYSKTTAVEYGTPLHGFALFVTDLPHEKIMDKLIRVRVVCIDAFGNFHEIIYKKGQDSNIYLLQDIAGIDIKDKRGGIVKK